MIIDFHCHTFPDKLAAHAMERMQSTSGHVIYSDGTASGLRASMKQAGIDYSVIVPVVTNPSKAGHINDISIAHREQDGLIYFGGIHPDTEDWHDELGRMAQAGLKGFKIHPMYQGVDIDDIRYLRILGRAAELGLVVIMHAGKDPSFLSAEHCSPKITRSALKQVEGVMLVAAHMGGMWEWDQVAEQLADTCVYLDTSNCLGRRQKTDGSYSNDPLRTLPDEQFCQLVNRFGKERILFASDSPWRSQSLSIQQIQALPLDQEVKDHIFYKNACRLLHINSL